MMKMMTMLLLKIPEMKNLSRRKQYGKMLVGPLTNVSTKCFKHVCCIWKVSKTNQSSVIFFIFYLWITSKKKSYQQLILMAKLELRYGLIWSWWFLEPHGNISFHGGVRDRWTKKNVYRRNKLFSCYELQENNVSKQIWRPDETHAAIFCKRW